MKTSTKLAALLMLVLVLLTACGGEKATSTTAAPAIEGAPNGTYKATLDDTEMTLSFNGYNFTMDVPADQMGLTDGSTFKLSGTFTMDDKTVKFKPDEDALKTEMRTLVKKMLKDQGMDDSVITDDMINSMLDSQMGQLTSSFEQMVGTYDADADTVTAGENVFKK